MQNLVFLMEPSEEASNISLKGGNMILNRFCIDEDAAFELSGVNYLKRSYKDMGNFGKEERYTGRTLERHWKGKEFLI